MDKGQMSGYPGVCATFLMHEGSSQLVHASTPSHMACGEAQPPSRPINLHLRPTGLQAPAVLDRLDTIQAEVEAQEEKRRARDKNSALKFRHCLRAICLDIDEAYRSDRKMLVGVSRDKTALTGNPANPDFVAVRPFLAALNGLLDTGYVEQISLGSESSGKRTRVRGTAKLNAALQIGHAKHLELDDSTDPIRLKIGKPGRPKKRLAFDEDFNTIRWRQNLERINTTIARYNIRLDVPRAQWERMEAERQMEAAEKAPREKKPYDYERINLSKTKLHRVFNSADWAEGGRFYGGWWQSVPGRYRQFITINGKPTCEYDFSALHLCILYAKANKPVPHSEAPYNQPYGSEHRDAVKRAFNVMLNCRKTPSSDLVPEFSTTQTGMTWQAFVRGIKDHHAAIAHHFNTGIGRQLQRIDSDIAEAVVLALADKQYPCLPIHDSFITYATLADEFQDIVAAAVSSLERSPLHMKLEFLAQYVVEAGPVTEDIGTILENGLAEGWLGAPVQAAGNATG